MSDTFYQILAVSGALAWLSPIIVPWIIKKFTDTKLTVISHKQFEIGYTTLGPIFNINLAFLAKDKDALIEKIDVHLQHEKKEINYFIWDWFEEQLLQLETPDMGAIPFRKNQKAIAINALTNTLVEKKVGFQNPEFQKRYNELFYSTNEAYNNIINAGQDLKTIAGKKEYNDFKDHLRNSFFWKIGKYTADIDVFISNRKEPYKHQVSFQLTNLDLKTLDRNIEMCLNILQNHYIDLDPKHRENWKWVNPNKMEE